MRQMQYRVILLVGWLALLFNIERVDINHHAIVNLAPFVYILATLSVVLLLTIPMQRQMVLLVTTVVVLVYIVLKLWYPLPFFVGINKYLTITELVALFVTIGLSFLVSQALQDFIGAVEAVSLPEKNTKLLSHNTFLERTRVELGRARRHQRPLSIATLKLDKTSFDAALHQAAREAYNTMVERYVKVRFGLFLAGYIRETDTITYQNKQGHFLLLAPETSGFQLNTMLERLASIVHKQTGIQFDYNVADFPQAALTLDELIKQAEANPAQDSSLNLHIGNGTKESAHDRQTH